MKTIKSILALGAALTMGVSTANAATIMDDFDVDSSASYTVLQDAAPDSSFQFAYDYSADGIASAPNTVGGTTLGLRLTANDTSGPSADPTLQEDHITAFHNTVITAPEYRMTVDVYMGVNATSGTTEHAHVGVAGDGVTVNSIFTPIQGSGHFLAFTGDGGSSSDYRHRRGDGTLANSGDASYLDPANTTQSTGALYQSIFPNTDFPGSPGNVWTTLEIEVAGGLITYSFDGVDIIQDTYSGANGQVSLGLADLFDSVASPAGSQFVIYDNLKVEVIPEPASLALLGLGGLMMIRRRRN